LVSPEEAQGDDDDPFGNREPSIKPILTASNKARERERTREFQEEE
jgi:hypothetical protein